MWERERSERAIPAWERLRAGGATPIDVPVTFPDVPDACVWGARFRVCAAREVPCTIHPVKRFFPLSPDRYEMAFRVVAWSIVIALTLLMQFVL